MEMEKVEDQKSPRSAPTTQSNDASLPENTPPRPQTINQMTSLVSGSTKIAGPTPLLVPKSFKYPEIYTSPTDQIMSPVSKGLLARTKSKKASFRLPPSSIRNQQLKIQVSKFEELDALKI